MNTCICVFMYVHIKGLPLPLGCKILEDRDSVYLGHLCIANTLHGV